MDFSIASDHAAVDMKNQIIEFLRGQGHTVNDKSPADKPADNYAEAADRVCTDVKQNAKLRGILICGTGQGTAIRANRHSGIRAALVTNEYMAEMARLHNNANIIVFGSRITTQTMAKRMLAVFINTPYEGGRHEERLKSLEAPVK
ncbi:MAG: ribose 5-phosphate isomerase B [Magnetococcales bacterium]|nr:ribose 5-phosphate isomerase B [Magnetococcales bacterium]|tara:strand:- start:492483 stop:492920 length:438 start_codon:yes stop_codon:yes gene_type:complete